MNKKEILFFSKYFHFIDNVKYFFQGKKKLILSIIGASLVLVTYLLLLFLLDVDDWHNRFILVVVYTSLFGISFLYLIFKYLSIIFNYLKFSKTVNDNLIHLFFLMLFIISYFTTLVINIIASININIYKSAASGFDYYAMGVVNILTFFFLLFLSTFYSIKREVNENVVFINDFLILNKDIRKIEKTKEVDGHIGFQKGRVCTLKIYFSDSKYVLVKVFNVEVEKIIKYSSIQLVQ